MARTLQHTFRVTKWAHVVYNERQNEHDYRNQNTLVERMRERERERGQKVIYGICSKINGTCAAN